MVTTAWSILSWAHSDMKTRRTMRGIDRGHPRHEQHDRGFLTLVRQAIREDTGTP